MRALVMSLLLSVLPISIAQAAIPVTWPDAEISDFINSGSSTSGPLPLSLVVSDPSCDAGAATVTVQVDEVGAPGPGTALEVTLTGTISPFCSARAAVEAPGSFAVPVVGAGVTDLLWTINQTSSATTGLAEGFHVGAGPDNDGAVSTILGGGFQTDPRVLNPYESSSGVPQKSGLYDFLSGDDITMPWRISFSFDAGAGGASVSETWLLLAELPPAAPESVPGIAHRWQLLTMVTVFVVVGVLAAGVRGRSLGATG